MALRLLPFRQYDEQDVVNIYALESGLALAATTDDGSGSNGVFVKVGDGNFNQELITYGSDSYLGKTNYPFVGGDMYPVNNLEVTPAGSGELPLGLTLNQTAKNDENGEKLLYNTTKKEELQAVLPGQTVPVATKGIFTLSANAMKGALASNKLGVGSGVMMATGAADKGKITGVAPTDSAAFGTVIGTGSRAATNGGLTDQFAGEFVVVKIG
jgi:hypothetical protein